MGGNELTSPPLGTLRLTPGGHLVRDVKQGDRSHLPQSVL